MSNDFTDQDFKDMLFEMEKKPETSNSITWTPKEGITPIRILTPLKQFNEKVFFQTQIVHWVNGHRYLCLNQKLTDKDGNVHEPCSCPLCDRSHEYYNLAGKDKNSDEWKLGGEFRKREQHIARIIVRGKKSPDGKDDEATPEFWAFGKKIYDYFLNQIRLGEAGNFLDLKTGRDFNLSKVGSGKETDYSASSLSMKTSALFTLPDGSIDVEKCKKTLSALPEMSYSKIVEFKTPEELNQVAEERIKYGKGSAAQQFVNPAAMPTDTESAIDAAMSGTVSVAPAQSVPANPQEQNLDDILNMF